MEVWKPIPGYEKYYEASSEGKIRSLRKEMILTPWVHKRGYRCVCLCVDKCNTSFTVHSLVLLAFVGPRPPGMECCHANGIKHDNRLANLRYDTPEGNRADNVKNGSYVRGEGHSQARFTEEDIRRIRKLAGDMADGQLATMFEVSRTTIRNIIERKTWRHVPD